MFVPFVSEVRIGIGESSAAAVAALGSLDADDGQQTSAPPVSGSPPHQSPLLATHPAPPAPAAPAADKPERDRVRTTPPSSPNISSLGAQ